MKIQVHNLVAAAVEEDVLKAFQAFGSVERVNIARSSTNGRSRGFGYVDVAVEADGHAMITGMDGADLFGKRLRVSQAHRKNSRP